MTCIKYKVLFMGQAYVLIKIVLSFFVFYRVIVLLMQRAPFLGTDLTLKVMNGELITENA